MSESAFWNEDWMKTQQKYWETWTDMSRQAMGMKQPVKSPLESAMEHWWQGLSPGTNDMTRDFMNKMMEQTQNYFRMADGYYKNAGQSNDWMDAANRTVADLQKLFSGNMDGIFGNTESAGDDALHKMMAFWEMPMDNWQRMISSLSLMPGDLLRNMPHTGDLDRFLSAPGLGYTREEERQYKQLTQRVVEYQRCLGEYMGFFSNLGMLSANRLKEKIEALIDEGNQVDSARGLYDLWVGSSEEVYGEQVMTPEYAKIHGRLVNSLMALKHKLGQLVDEALGGMNMPTRRELRTLQDRLQESRRESKAMHAEIELLKEQMIELRSLATNKQQTSAAPTKRSSTPKKKAVAKKKAAAKKN
ncbi:MAG: class III poly(R)-hydroxyalkanoic acid synthase subunit PhaE [Candidatus Thiodiazotropha endolucinida]